MTNAEKFLSRCGMRKKGEMTEDAVKCLKKKKESMAQLQCWSKEAFRNRGKKLEKLINELTGMK